MIKQYVIVDEKYRDEPNFEDMEWINTYRGRFIHLLTILERIMKEYCNKPYTKDTFGKTLEPYITKLKNDGYEEKEGFDDFTSALHKINPSRTNWAHGFVYYKKKFDSQPNNFIKLGAVKESIRPPYFDELHKLFELIFDWIKKNNLMKIKGYEIKVAEYQDNSPRIKLESIKIGE